MTGINVNVKPEIISWILHTLQFQNVAGSVIDLLNKWQTGEKTPTFNQVEDMSRKTNIPFGYFFLDKPPVEECSIAEYRTVNSATIAGASRNLMDTVDLMTDIQEWMVEYVTRNGQEELGYVGCAAKTTNIPSVVTDIRKKLDIDIDWYVDRKNPGDAFRFLKKRVENIGVLVMMSGIVGNNTHRKLDISEFRAFTLANKYVPLIFINSCDSEAGKLFSLIHELVHVWVGENSFYNDEYSSNYENHGEEKFCNAAAAEILIPTESFFEKWESSAGETIDKIELLAGKFRCSKFAVARKALDNKKITQKVYEDIVKNLTKSFQEWKNKQQENRTVGGDYYRTLISKTDRRLVKALARSASEGQISYTEVYRLTNTNRKTFERLINEIGGIG